MDAITFVLGISGERIRAERLGDQIYNSSNTVSKENSDKNNEISLYEVGEMYVNLYYFIYYIVYIYHIYLYIQNNICRNKYRKLYI